VFNHVNVDIYLLCIYSELYLVNVSCCEKIMMHKNTCLYGGMLLYVILVFYAQLSNCIYIFVEHGQLDELVFLVVC
jgi:hypothetical protein